MKTQESSTKVIIDLRDELTAEELESFRKQAELSGRSLQEHAVELLFGRNEKKAS